MRSDDAWLAGTIALGGRDRAAGRCPAGRCRACPGRGSVGGSANAGGPSRSSRVEQVVRVRVAVGQRAEIPLRLDQLQDRRVVVHLVRHVVVLGERRHDDGRHPEAVAVVRARDAGHVEAGRDVVGLDRGRRRNVVVVAAVFVVRVDEHRVLPVRDCCITALMTLETKFSPYGECRRGPPRSR